MGDESEVIIRSPELAPVLQTVGAPHWVLSHLSAMRTVHVCAAQASWATSVTAARTTSSSWMVTQGARSVPPAMLW